MRPAALNVAFPTGSALFACAIPATSAIAAGSHPLHPNFPYVGNPW